jgi:ArsR family transcriptional regulator, arsenate/arsenite/antimonite-responsive transcriptional repressor
MLNDAFKALNDATRREILELLKKGDLTAGEIVEKFDMTGPSISHHLEILKRAGLIEGRKEGQFIIYSINMTVVDDILSWVTTLSKKSKKSKNE